MTISKRQRFEILRRDNHSCRYCGAVAPDVKLTVDHVIPVALGGSDDGSNLVAACHDCNAGKSSTSPDSTTVAQASSDALRWKVAMQIVADERAAATEHREKMLEWFVDHWNGWKWTDSRGDKHTVELPGNFRASIDQFIIAGLTTSDLGELVDVAMSAWTNDEWRYFCGCCWRRIRESTERAAQILAEADDV